ncbi:hypothetical protein [Streptomyces sp. NPDC048350]|uniref:hypothetical protein n=1 Tax=Streptomyces sp. NPDC048350 TaxID=3365538 RepID=UPI0037182662
METAEPVTGAHLDTDEPRLPLLTAAEALQAIDYLKRLGTLDTTHHGYAAGQLATDLARRMPPK